jgi:hypothetical protein
MYVDTVPNRNSRPAILLREGWREGSRTRKRTLANLTDWPPAQVDALRAVLRGDFSTLAPSPGFAIERTRPHGHVAAVLGTLRRLRLESLLATRRGLSALLSLRGTSADQVGIADGGPECSSSKASTAAAQRVANTRG